MTIDETNVIVFEPRRPEAPTVQFVELRLSDDFSIEMLLHGDAGDVVARLEYRLAAKSPENFDLDLLREAWSRWRGFSEVAS
jgi:hypothetical protein